MGLALKLLNCVAWGEGGEEGWEGEGGELWLKPQWPPCLPCYVGTCLLSFYQKLISSILLLSKCRNSTFK